MSPPDGHRRCRRGELLARHHRRSSASTTTPSDVDNPASCTARSPRTDGPAQRATVPATTRWSKRGGDFRTSSPASGPARCSSTCRCRASVRRCRVGRYQRGAVHARSHRTRAVGRDVAGPGCARLPDTDLEARRDAHASAHRPVALQGLSPDAHASKRATANGSTPCSRVSASRSATSAWTLIRCPSPRRRPATTKLAARSSTRPANLPPARPRRVGHTAAGQRRVVPADRHRRGRARPRPGRAQRRVDRRRPCPASARSSSSATRTGSSTTTCRCRRHRRPVGEHTTSVLSSLADVTTDRSAPPEPYISRIRWRESGCSTSAPRWPARSARWC